MKEPWDDFDLRNDTPTPLPNIEPNDIPPPLPNIETDPIVPPIEHDKHLTNMTKTSSSIEHDKHLKPRGDSS